MSLFNFLRDFELVKNFYFDPLKELKLTVFFRTTSTEITQQVVQRITEIGTELGLNLDPNGYMTLRSLLFNSIIDNFLKSFAFSFLTTFVLFIFIFKSLKWASIAMLPNFIPLIFISGFMGVLGIPVEGNLVMMICISFGIAVDDTIHFLLSLKKYLKVNKSMKASIKSAFNDTSGALLGTTLVFVTSFPCFFLSDMRLYREVGGFVIGSLVLALIADFILLPAILYLFDPDRYKMSKT